MPCPVLDRVKGAEPAQKSTYAQSASHNGIKLILKKKIMIIKFKFFKKLMGYTKKAAKKVARIEFQVDLFSSKKSVK